VNQTLEEKDVNGRVKRIVTFGWRVD